MSELKITILYGSYRAERLGIRAVSLIEKACQSFNCSPTVVDAQALSLPLIERRYVDYAAGEAPQVLENLKALFQENTDAFVLVSGEYNGTLQPGLKNLLDHFYSEYFHRPAGLVTYSTGPLGAPRVSADLRTLSGILGMPAIPSILSIPQIHETLSPEGQDSEGKFEKTLQKFLKELCWYAQALKRQRTEVGKP